MTPAIGSPLSPANIALVPLEETGPATLDRLAPVAAALQIQVTRDLSPIWGVSATVSAFGHLEDVPAGYLQLIVVGEPLHRRGFHFTMGGVPFAMVQWTEDNTWTVAASHELIEMLCNPFAQRIEPGLLDDLTPRPPARGQPLKGPANYLVEVCDPCETQTYSINGVQVGDFVTPSYYRTGPGSSGPYSFTEKVQSPLEVLEDCYVSWRALPPATAIFQGRARSKSRLILEVNELPSSGGPAGAQKAPVASSAAGVRAGLQAFIQWMGQNKQPPPSLGQIHSFLQSLSAPDSPAQAATSQSDKAVARYLAAQQNVAGIFGPDFTDSSFALWECMHIA